MVYTSTDMGKLQAKDVCRPGCVMPLAHSCHIDHSLLSTVEEVFYEGIQIRSEKCQALVYVKLSKTRS